MLEHSAGRDVGIVDEHFFWFWLSMSRQSASMAHKDVTADSIYSCTGQPLPRDIKHMVFSLMNDSFEQAFDCELKFGSLPLLTHLLLWVYAGISEMQTTKGLALVDIVRGIHAEVKN